MSALARGVLLAYRKELPAVLVLDIDLFDVNDQHFLGQALTEFPRQCVLIFAPKGNLEALSVADAKEVLQALIDREEKPKARIVPCDGEL